MSKLNYFFDIFIYLFFVLWDTALCIIAIQNARWGILALTACIALVALYSMIESIIYLKRGNNKHDT